MNFQFNIHIKETTANQCIINLQLSSKITKALNESESQAKSFIYE